jgi:thioredoxin reductase
MSINAKELVIIGAGPAGLRAGEEALRLGIDYLILEQGKVGQAWREIRPQMPMLSPNHPQRDWTSISPRFPIWKLNIRRPFCNAADFVTYLQSYAEHFNLNIMSGTPVKKITQTNGLFHVEAGHHEIRCKTMLVCTGMFGNPYIPTIPGIQNHPLVMHSHFYLHPEPFRGKRVLVIGGGNSGAEIAIDLAGSAQVSLLTRDPLKFFSKTQNLCDIRGISESYLLELIKMKLIRHLEGGGIRCIQDNKLQLDRQWIPFDRIICATGYHPHVTVLTALPFKLNPRTKFPLITPAAEARTIENLFLAGPLAYRGMGSLFIHGFIKELPEIMKTIKQRIHSK